MLLFVAMLAVSTSPIIARYLDNVPSVTISFWRMSFGALFLWFMCMVKKQSPLNQKNLKKTLIAGIFLGIHFALFFESIKLTTIANATFLGTLAPVFTFLIEKFFLKKHHAFALIIGLMISLFGASIIIWHRFDFYSGYTIGNLLAILCSVFLGIAFVISENVRKEVGTISYTRTLFTTAAITLFFISLIGGIRLTSFSQYDLYGLLLLGIIPTIIGHGLMYYAIRYFPPTIVSSIPMGEPILASFMAWILFQELIGIVTFIGGSFTLFGLIIMVWKNN